MHPASRKQNAAVLLVLLLAPCALLAQTATSNNTPQSAATAPQPPETQQPLDVDRDPVISPDAADNAPAKPASGNEAPQTARSIDKQGGQYTLRENVQEVVLSATVLDDQGRLVNDLTKDDFRIMENNAPQTLLSFQHADTPVSMGIVVDNSGSMRSKRDAVNSAALDLVRASNPQDEAFIVNFSDEAFLDQDFTSNLHALADGLAHYEAKGGTALYDATVASADNLAHHAKRAKQVLLVITDGEDNASGLTLDQTIRRVQNLQGPIIYCVGLLFGDDGGGRETRQAKRALQLLAEETGGIAYFPKSLDEVDAIANEVARDIRSQYMLGYHSTQPQTNTDYRTVKVFAHPTGSKKQLNVRTRSGYYPRPEGPSGPGMSPNEKDEQQ